MKLLRTHCRIIGPHFTVRGKSHGFSRVAVGTWGKFSSYGGDSLSKLMFVQQRPDSCLVMRINSGISTRLGRATQMLLEVSRDKEGLFLLGKMILGFLSIFKKSQALSPFEALNSACLSRCHRDVRPLVQERWGRRAFSRVYTGDLFIPSTCEMKDEPAFMPKQRNPAFFRVSASQCPFHLRQQNQGPSHILITEGSLLLRCFWKVGIPLQLKPGHQLSAQDDLVCTELSSICYAEIGFPLDLRRVSQGISAVA